MKNILFITLILFLKYTLAQEEPVVVQPDPGPVDMRQYFSVVTKIANPKFKDCEIFVLKHYEETGLWFVQVDRRTSGRANKITIDDFLEQKVEYYGKVGYYYKLSKILIEGEKFKSVAPDFKHGQALLKVGYEYNEIRGEKEIPLGELKYFSNDYSEASCLD